MAWNNTVEAEYDEMLDGPIGDALGFTGYFRDWSKNYIKIFLEDLETGNTYLVNLEPQHATYLTFGEIFTLHSMRVACFLFSERLKVFPWQLRDKSVEELGPLLNWHYQGWRDTGPSPSSNGMARYEFEGVWDTCPADRMTEASFSYLLLTLFGEAVSTEEEFILHMIQHMRDGGWSHGVAIGDEYVGYQVHGDSYAGVYEYNAVAEVKRGGCHVASNFMVAYLRPFNIPAHRGREWPSSVQPPNRKVENDEYWKIAHLHGHCFVHFHSVRWSMDHGDNIYYPITRYLPPNFSLRSESWMQRILPASEYEWYRARLFDDYFWWCILVTRSPNYFFDVVNLYNLGMLRDELENLHIDRNLASRPGAPNVVPPIFNQNIVNFLMDWVRKRVS